MEKNNISEDLKKIGREVFYLHKFAEKFEPPKNKKEQKNYIHPCNYEYGLLNSFIKKRCKLAILWTLSKGKKIHVIIDGFDFRTCFKKHQPTYTSSEVRFIYRNWSYIKDIFPGQIIFYADDKILKTPWEDEPCIENMANQYSPRHPNKYSEFFNKIKHPEILDDSSKNSFDIPKIEISKNDSGSIDCKGNFEEKNNQSIDTYDNSDKKTQAYNEIDDYLQKKDTKSSFFFRSYSLKESLLRDLQDKINNPAPEKTLSDIIEDWKNQEKKYINPHTGEEEIIKNSRMIRFKRDIFSSSSKEADTDTDDFVKRLEEIGAPKKLALM